MALIYAIDDEINIRRLLKQILEGEGHEVETFATCEETMEAIKEKEPDMLFTEITLPSMDGIEVLRLLKDEAYMFPVAVVSSITSPQAITTAFKYGIVDFITKPFAPQEIGETVERFIKDEQSLQKRSRQIRKLIESGEKRKAMLSTRELFRDFPGSPIPHFLLGLILKDSNTNVAIKHMRASLDLDENFKEAADELRKMEEI